MILYLTDGTTTIDLTGDDDGIGGCTYFPATGEANAATVADRIDLILRGTAAEIRAATNSIELLLDAARRRQALGVGPRIYAMYAPVDTDDEYRSELLDGRLIWSDTPALRRLNDGATVDIVAAAGLVFERQPFWDGEEAELKLSSVATTPAAIGGAAITNDPAPAVGNYIDIAATAIAGTLPGPVRLRYTNTTGSGVPYTHLYLGNNAFADPSSYDQVIQGEDCIPGYVGSSDHTDATASGGKSRKLTLTATSTKMIAWLLDADLVANAGGRYFRLLARIDVLTAATVRVIPTIYDYYNLVELWRGGEVSLNAGFALHDLGAVPIPPGAYGSGYAAVTLALFLRAATPGDVYLDYINLFGMDAYRHIYQVGMTVADDDSLEIDEIEGQYYHLAGAAKHPILVPLDRPLLLYPGVAQRIHILHSIATGDSPIANTATVQLWHRPRRATV